MKDFKKVTNEVNRTLSQVVMFDIILDGILIFLSLYLVLSLLKFYPLLSLLPSGIYTAYLLSKRISADKIRWVEKAYANLNEKLRTARDNWNVENPIVEELQEEVRHELGLVRVSSFVNTKRLSIKIGVAIALSFIIVISGLLNLDFTKISFEGPEEIPLNIPNRGKNTDIYGEESIAKLGDEQVDIQIKQVSFEIDIRDVRDAPDKEFDSIFPEEVFAESAEGFEESVPIEQQQLIKDYFKNLAKG